MNIFKDGMLFDVNVRFWSGAKILQAQDLGLKAEDIAEAFKLGKKMLVPEKIMRGFRAVEAQARRIVSVNSFPFTIGSAYFVPKKKIARVLKVIEQCKTDYNALISSLVANYAAYQEEMRPIYLQAAEAAFLTQAPTGTQEFSIEGREAEKDAFIQTFMRRVESFYPPADTLAGRFSLNCAVYKIALPEMETVDTNQLLMEDAEKQAVEMYQEQMHERINTFIEDVVKTLRNETLEICDKITQSIVDGKVFTERTVNSLEAFINNFTDMNFVGDETIEEHLNSLQRDFLNRYPADKVQGDMELQAELKRRLGVIKTAAENLTEIDSIVGVYEQRTNQDAIEQEVA